MAKSGSYEEVLKVVFPLLDGKELATCMLVCKQWRDIARDDYFWKCVCVKRWPSICKSRSRYPLSYHKLFITFSNHPRCRTILPPRLSFGDLEFYIDIWSEDKLLFSEVVAGPVLRTGIRNPPPGVGDAMRARLTGSDYMMTIPVEPRFSVPLTQSIRGSILVGRKDTNKMACIVSSPLFDYVDSTAFRVHAYDYLEFSPVYPFAPDIRAWVSLLFLEDGNEGVIDVFGIEMDFCNAASSEDEVLWLLDMLDWK